MGERGGRESRTIFLWAMNGLGAILEVQTGGQSGQMDEGSHCWGIRDLRRLATEKHSASGVTKRLRDECL